MEDIPQQIELSEKIYNRIEFLFNVFVKITKTIRLFCKNYKPVNITKGKL